MPWVVPFLGCMLVLSFLFLLCFCHFSFLVVMFWTSVNSDVSQLKLPFIKKKQLLTNDLLAEVKVFKEKAHGSKLARLVTSGHSGSQYAQCRSGDDRTFYCPSLRTLQVLSSSDLSTAKGLGCSSGVLLRCQDEDTKAIPCDILIFVEHF